jgi:hypothetical protein
MAGQINRGWHMGDTLYELARRPEVERVLEIGTWHGDGSTFVLANALAETGGRLWSIELKSEHYQQACDFYADKSLPVELLQGLSVSADWYPPFDHYWPRIELTSQEKLEPGSYFEWYEDEIEHANRAARHSLVESMIEEHGPFDMVLFDGGEFASDREFELLEEHITHYVVMDDTNPDRCIKNSLSRARILSSRKWSVIADAIDERNGWLAASRV